MVQEDSQHSIIYLLLIRNEGGMALEALITEPHSTEKQIPLEKPSQQYTLSMKVNLKGVNKTPSMINVNPTNKQSIKDNISILKKRESLIVYTEEFYMKEEKSKV